MRAFVVCFADIRLLVIVVKVRIACAYLIISSRSVAIVGFVLLFVIEVLTVVRLLSAVRLLLSVPTNLCADYARFSIGAHGRAVFRLAVCVEPLFPQWRAVRAGPFIAGA